MAGMSKKGVRGHGELGERLRRRRKALGLTAKDLARSAGVSPSYVSQLERGKQDRPSLDVLGALAGALGVSTSELIGEHLAVPVTPQVPPALSSLSEDLALDPATTAMLAAINVDGRQPATREGWLLVLLAIRHACVESASAEALAQVTG